MNVGANLEAEIAKYLAMLQADPASKAFAPLAEAYRKQGKLQEAVNLCKQGLAKNPDYSGAQVLLAQLYADLKQFAPAENELLALLRRTPNHLLAHQILLRIYAHTGRHQHAGTIAQRLLKLQPNEPMATTYLQQAKAAKPATTAAAVTAAPPVPTVTMAKLYEDQGHLEKALEIYRQLATQQPALLNEVKRVTEKILNRQKVGVLNQLLDKIKSGRGNV